MGEERESIEVEIGTVLSIKGSNWLVKKTDLNLAEMSGSLSLRWVGTSVSEAKTMDEDKPVITIDFNIDSKDTLKELKAIKREAKKATAALNKLKGAQNSLQSNNGKIYCDIGEISGAVVRKLRAGERASARARGIN